MERRYIALCDDGHDYKEIIFTSSHRAGSKANQEDAEREIIRKLGYARFKQLEIIRVERHEFIE